MASQSQEMASQSRPMNFTENHQGSAILDKLLAQRREGRFCDVIFHVQSREFGAHRNVLAASSPYFDTVLRVDRHTDKIGVEHVSVDCHTERIFEVLLDYLYTGSISIAQDYVEELIQLATRFMISRLAGYCLQYLETNLQVSNCFMIQSIAQRCGLGTLAKMVEAFLMANILDILQQDEILFFSEKKIQTFVANKSWPMREELKIHVINRWIQHMISQRLPLFEHLLRLISWDKVNIPVLHTIINEEVLYKNNDWCLYTMLNVLDEKDLLSGPYRVTQKQLHDKFSACNTASHVLQLAISSEQLDNSAAGGGSLALTSDHFSLNPSGCEAIPQTNYIKQEQSRGGHEDQPQTELGSHSDGVLTAPCIESQAASDPYLDRDVCGDQHGEDDEEDTSLDLLHSSLELDDKEHLLRAYPESSVVSHDTSDHQYISQTLPLLGTDADHADNDNDDDDDGDDDSEFTVAKRGKRKRKGTPVKIDPSPIKVCISKAKINLEGTAPRKRGRPRKNPAKYPDMPKKPQTLKVKLRSDQTRKDSGKNSRKRLKSDSDTEDYSDDNVPTSPAKQRRRRKNHSDKCVHTSDLNCQDCKFITSCPEKLEKHREKAHKDQTVYSCPLCSFKSSWNRDYYSHVKDDHFPGPPFVCDFSCGYSVDRIQTLLCHRMIHTDERPFLCTICNVGFRSKTNLALHGRSHTGLKPFKCEVCDRYFATKGTLDQHSVTHSELRPYLCDKCGFSTKYQSHLIAHKRIHTGDVFKCQYPNCRYSTPKRSQLACHMRTHMSIRSHVCTVCGRAFVEKSHMIRHEKIHLDDKPFKCDHCEYGSTRRDKLKEHITKYHPQKDADDSGSLPRTPYKARKARRQTFDPQASGLQSSEQASQEMHILLQQSETARLQEQLQAKAIQQSATARLQEQLQAKAETKIHGGRQKGLASGDPPQPSSQQYLPGQLQDLPAPTTTVLQSVVRVIDPSIHQCGADVLSNSVTSAVLDPSVLLSSSQRPITTISSCSTTPQLPVIVPRTPATPSGLTSYQLAGSQNTAQNTAQHAQNTPSQDMAQRSTSYPALQNFMNILID